MINPASIDRARNRWITKHVSLRQSMEGFLELPPNVKVYRVADAIFSDLIRQEGAAVAKREADGDEDDYERVIQEIAHIAKQIDRRGPEILADIEELDKPFGNSTERFQ